MRYLRRKLLQQQITTDKGEIEDFSKLPLATSFIRKTLYEIADSSYKIELGGEKQ